MHFHTESMPNICFTETPHHEYFSDFLCLSDFPSTISTISFHFFLFLPCDLTFRSVTFLSHEPLKFLAMSLNCAHILLSTLHSLPTFSKTHLLPSSSLSTLSCLSFTHLLLLCFAPKSHILSHFFLVVMT